MGGFKEVSREYGSREGFSNRIAWISKHEENNENVSQGLHLSYRTMFLTGKARGKEITTSRFCCLYNYIYIYTHKHTHLYVYVSACVGSKSLCSFASKEGFIIHIQNTNPMGQGPGVSSYW